MENWSPQEDVHFQLPTKHELGASSEVLAKRRLAYRQEFTEAFNAYQQYKKSGQQSNLEALLACQLAKAALKMASTCKLPDEFAFQNFKQLLTQVLGPNKAEVVLAGWAGELAFAKGAADIEGATVYLPSEGEDVHQGVDLWVDFSGAELDDFATEQTRDLDYEQRQYMQAAISIKALKSVPTNDFPLLISCRTIEELQNQMAAHRDDFVDYWKGQQISGSSQIDQDWLALEATCLGAAKKMHGYVKDRNADVWSPRFKPLNRKYENVLPFVGLVPSLNRSLSQFDRGFPRQVLIDTIAQSMLAEVGNA